MVLPELGRITRGVYRRARFAMPSLFCFGTRDVGFPPPITRRLFNNPEDFGPDVQLALIKGAGHYLVDEAPQDITAQILEFFASNAGK